MYAIFARGIVVVVDGVHIIVGVTSNHFAIIVTNRDIRSDTMHTTRSHSDASLLLIIPDDILVTSLGLRHRRRCIDVRTTD